MSDTSTVQVPITKFQGSFVQVKTEAARGEQGAVHIAPPEGGITHHLSRLEQIVEYLKVLYR